MTFYSTDLAGHEDTKKIVVSAPPPQPSWYRKSGKRAFDLLLVIVSAPFWVPVIALLALAVLATGQAPFYIQERIGLKGEIFRIWKLRTMLPNAKERLEAHLARNPEARIEWNEKQKLANDPRITQFGRFLRKSSLDELPQLINVLNGTMSLVGPRPMMPEQKVDYHGEAYYRLRPGMSGLWQVSKRSDGDFVARVRYDEKYDRRVSLTTDLRVLGQTVGVVLRGTGV